MAPSGLRLIEAGGLIQAGSEVAPGQPQFAPLADIIPDCIAQFDKQLRFLYVNPAWARTTGRPREDFLGKALDKMGLPPETARHLAIASRRVLNTGYEETIEFLLHHGSAGRNNRCYESLIVPVLSSNGELVSVLAIARDITEARESQAALKRSEERVRIATSALAGERRQANEFRLESERRLHELNETFELVEERTLLAERRAAEVQDLALELTRVEQSERTGFAQLLHDHLQQLLVAAKLHLSMIEKEVSTEERKRIAEVKDLLTQSIEAARSVTLELSPPVLAEPGLEPALRWLVGWVAQKYGLEIQLHLDPEIPALITPFKLLIFQTIRELLFNVLKHPGVRSARLLVSTLPENRLMVRIDDDGDGLDSAVQIAADTNGGDRALSSIRHRVNLAGGELTLRTAPGIGTSLILEIPCESAVPASPPGDETAGQPDDLPGSVVRQSSRRTRRSVRILLVEDHQIVREGLAGILREQADLELVGEAADGLDAIQMARQLQPDVVVMDIDMPRMNGIDATRRISAEFPTVRVIGLSMHEEPSLIEAMRRAGADACFTKDGPSHLLLGAIRDRQGTAA